MKIIGLALVHVVRLLQLGGRSCFEYLHNDLIRAWTQTDTLCGTKVIKNWPLKVHVHVS